MSLSRQRNHHGTMAHASRSFKSSIANASRLGGAAALVLLIALVLHMMASKPATREVASTPTVVSAISTGFGTLQARGQLFQSADGGMHWSPASQPNVATSTDPVAFALSPTVRWVGWWHALVAGLATQCRHFDRSSGVRTFTYCTVGSDNAI
jgi:hypothetical protein